MVIALYNTQKTADFFSSLPSRQEEKPVQQYNIQDHLLT